MSEEQIISLTDYPMTKERICKDLRNIGLREGMTVIVHCSLSSIGWICGGETALIQGLMEVVTPLGNIVMPTQTGNLSDPREWENPPVPREWWEVIKESMPAYREDITPTYGMGRVAEAFRKWPGVYRSSHPQVSFGAWGKDALKIVESHQLDYGLGENSPLGKIYNLDGYVLMIGVGYDKNTSFHLAEHRAPIVKIIEQGAPIMNEKERVWKKFKSIEYDTDFFTTIGREYEALGEVSIGSVGRAKSRLFSQKKSVNFAEKLIEKKRKDERKNGSLSPL